MLGAMLTLELDAAGRTFRAGEPITLRGTYRNAGSEPLALAFWWCRRMRVTGAGGLVAPGPGPVLPCGVAEEWLVLAPGERHVRDEPLACTQPAGRAEAIGWSFDLAPGAYRVALLFEAPPAHGFTQSAPDPRAFRGRVESNEVEVRVEPRPGLLARLFG